MRCTSTRAARWTTRRNPRKTHSSRSRSSSRICRTPPPTSAPRVETGDPPDRRPEELLNIIPPNRRRSYDARKLIRLVVDNGEFFEMRKHWAGAIITGFARLDGYSVGVMASDPLKLAGAMDGWAAEKYTHFVDLCDAFNLPVVVFLDMPGFMLGSHAERKATMRPWRARVDCQRRGERAKGGVQRAQGLRRGSGRRSQPGTAQRPEPAVRLARGRVGRHPYRGRRRGGVQARDRGGAGPPTRTGR